MTSLPQRTTTATVWQGFSANPQKFFMKEDLPPRGRKHAGASCENPENMIYCFAQCAIAKR
jgi:hypothetical protein